MNRQSCLRRLIDLSARICLRNLADQMIQKSRRRTADPSAPDCDRLAALSRAPAGLFSYHPNRHCHCRHRFHRRRAKDRRRECSFYSSYRFRLRSLFISFLPDRVAASVFIYLWFSRIDLDQDRMVEPLFKDHGFAAFQVGDESFLLLIKVHRLAEVLAVVL